jgi:PAS domain S-box-containing protein
MAELLTAGVNRPARETSMAARVLAATTGHAILATDLDGTVRYANAGAERLLGRPAADLVGRCVVGPIYPADEVAALAAELGVPAGAGALGTAVHRGAGEERGWTYLRRDGRRVPVQVTITAMPDAAGRIDGYAHVARDVTAERAATAALRDAYERERAAAARLREVDRGRSGFLAAASHDLRTPLTSVLAYQELVLADPELGAEHREILAAAHRNSRRLLTLVGDLLTACAVDAGRLRPRRRRHPLGPIVAGVLDSLAGGLATRRLTVTADAVDAVVVDADADLLERALTNLLSNAVKFTPDGGSVAVTVTDRPDAVEISVRDTGTGIPADELPYVFDQFFRCAEAAGKAPGTGLGLAITKAIVQAHGGTIQASSDGAGTVFTFTVPHGAGDAPAPPGGPTLADLRSALDRAGLGADDFWDTLLDEAGAGAADPAGPGTVDPAGPDVAGRAVEALRGLGPVARLVALSLRVRARSPGFARPAGAAADDRALLAALAAPGRLAALARYDLSDPSLRGRLDELARRTATRLGTPAGMVSIVLDGAQLFVGAHGLTGWLEQVRGTPAEWSFCAHGVLGESPVYVVDEAANHPVHAGGPLVTAEGVRAYAGAQIVGPGGAVLGMHCVVDAVPRVFSREDILELRRTAAQIGALLEAYQPG